MTRITLSCLLLTLCFLAVGCGNKPVTVFIAQTALQEKVAAEFPTEQKSSSVTVTLSNPTVTMVEGTDRIGVELDLKLASSGRTFEGKIGVSGALTFQATTKDFRLKDTKIEKFEMGGMPPSLQTRFKAMANDSVGGAVQKISVHALDPAAAADVPDTFVLTSALVTTGVMKAVIGDPEG